MNQLDKDRLNWVQVANDVMAGKYIHADGSTIEALKMGLRAVDDPRCVKAIEMLGRKRRAR